MDVLVIYDPLDLLVYKVQLAKPTNWINAKNLILPLEKSN